MMEKPEIWRNGRVSSLPTWRLLCGNAQDRLQLRGRQHCEISGSVAANYTQADEALSDKDFLFRIKICRKEAKESGLWLRLLDTGKEQHLMSVRGA